MTYEIISKIASGTYGTVYKAQNSDDKKFYALKLIHEQYKNPTELKRIKRGFDSAKKVTHQNCVKMIEWYEDELQTGFVMEYVEGESISLETQVGESVQSKIAKVIQICNGLEALHSVGIIHRDLKPENILVTKEGKLKITDFDLVKLNESQTLTASGAFIGTIKYSSPEQCKDASRIDLRSDLYSLGVIFYEMVTGELPIKGDNLPQIALGHVRAPVVSPKILNPAIPNSVDKILLKLLAKNPQERFQNSRELALSLNKALAENFEDSTEEKQAYLLPPSFVSRAVELNVLEQAFSETTKKKCQTLFLVGESGIGKSRLWEEFKLGLDLQNALVLEGACSTSKNIFEPLQNIILKGIESLDEISDTEKLEVLGKLAWDLSKIQPNILTLPIFTKIDKLPELQGSSGQLRLFETVTTFFQNLSKLKSTLVLFLDDFHWADEFTAKWISYALGKFQNYPIMIVGTYRSTEMAQSSFNATIQDFKQKEVAKIIELKPLTLTQTVTLLTSILGKSDPVETDFAKVIFNATNGNPLFIRELIYNLFAKHQLKQDDGKWDLTAEYFKKIEIPNTVHSVVLARLKLLSKNVFELLQVASLVGKSFKFETVQITLAKSEEAIARLLENATNENLIFREKNLSYRFVHDVVRESFQNSLTKRRKIEFHKKIGNFLEKKFEHKEEEVIEELADHFFEAKENSKAFGYCQKAGRKANQNYAHLRALEYFEKSIEVVDKTTEPKKYINSMLNIANNYFLIGDWSRLESIVNEILEISIEIKDFHSYARTVNWYGGVFLYKTDYYKALEHYVVGYIFYKKIEMPLESASVLGNIATTLSSLGKYKEAQKKYDEALVDLRKLKNEREIARIIGHLGITYGQQGNYEKAVECFQYKIYVSKNLNDLNELESAYGNMGLALFHQGKYEEAIKYFEAEIEICEKAGYKYGLGNATRGIADSFKAIGKIEDAILNFEKSISLCEEIGIPHFSIKSLDGLALIFINEGNFENAIERLNEKKSLCETLKNEEELVKSSIELSKIYLELNQPEKAKEEISFALKSSENLNGELLEEKIKLVEAKILFKENAFNESLELLQSISNKILDFDKNILIGKINFALKKNDLAIKSFESMSKKYSKEIQQGQILLELAKVTESEKIKQNAITLFENLQKRENKFYYKKCLEELYSLKFEEFRLHTPLITSLIKWMTPETLFDELLSFLQKETDSYGCQIILNDAKTKKLETCAVSPNLIEEDVDFSKSVIEKAILDKKPTLIHNAVEVPEYEANKSIVGKIFLSVIAVPLRVKEEIIGALYIDRRDFEKGALTNSDLEKVVEISKILSPVILRQNEAMKMKIESDVKQLGIFIGNSLEMRKVYEEIKDAASVNFSVYIHGETGTGKELVAEALHKFSPRRNNPFILINCATIPENLAESELFGHEKGAFTGASSTQIGKFELANGGTIFLDEIGELPLILQSKLLRVLQNKEIWRVGGTSRIKTDVKIIVATHKDLEAEVANGNFREDLFHRLNVLKIEVPPLRKRSEDIPALIYNFIEKYSQETNKEIHGISNDALVLLCEQQWKGNVRELENFIAKLVVRDKGNQILSLDTLQTIAPKLKKKQISTTQSNSLFDSLNLDGESLDEIVNQFKGELVKMRLDKNDWKKAKTANELGISRVKLDRILKSIN
ncbi:MAG: tetratricopeptide repeat protein [Calditrichaeota bacterium]|nr:MAG: tetratricopeptide repeat protein [Calditrichota bacterium]